MHSLIKFIADECVTQSTFKSDVQSTLLGIIHELVKRQMSVLLAPTAGLWAKDMVDFVLTETGDKKVKFTFTIFHSHFSGNISISDWCCVTSMMYIQL